MKQDEAHWQGLWWLLLLCCPQVRSVLGCGTARAYLLHALAASAPALTGPVTGAAAVLAPGKYSSVLGCKLFTAVLSHTLRLQLSVVVAAAAVLPLSYMSESRRAAVLPEHALVPSSLHFVAGLVLFLHAEADWQGLLWLLLYRRQANSGWAGGL
jgi:hypothetical protein